MAVQPKIVLRGCLTNKARYARGAIDSCRWGMKRRELVRVWVSERLCVELDMSKPAHRGLYGRFALGDDMTEEMAELVSHVLTREDAFEAIPGEVSKRPYWPASVDPEGLSFRQ